MSIPHLLQYYGVSVKVTKLGTVMVGGIACLFSIFPTYVFRAGMQLCIYMVSVQHSLVMYLRYYTHFDLLAHY